MDDDDWDFDIADVQEKVKNTKLHDGEDEEDEERDLNKPDMSKFQDEEEGGEEEVKYIVPTSQPKKLVEKRFNEDKGAVEELVLDPEEYQQRKVRLQQESDLKNAQDLFGSNSQVNKLASMIPNTEKQFKEYADLLSSELIVTYKKDKNYKALVKQIVANMVAPMTLQECSDIASQVSGIREKKKKELAESEKQKRESAKKPKISLGRGKMNDVSMGDYEDYGSYDAQTGYDLEDDFM